MARMVAFRVSDQRWAELAELAEEFGERSVSSFVAIIVEAYLEDEDMSIVAAQESCGVRDA